MFYIQKSNFAKFICLTTSTTSSTIQSTTGSTSTKVFSTVLPVSRWTTPSSTESNDILKDSLESLLGFWSWQEDSELENVPSLDTNNPWKWSDVSTSTATVTTSTESTTTTAAIPITKPTITASFDLSWSWTDLNDEDEEPLQEIENNQLEEWSWDDTV